MTPSSRPDSSKAKRKAPPATQAAGPPQRLSYGLPVDAVTGRDASSVTAEFKGAKIDHLFAFDTISPNPDQLDVKVHLAPETPPGRYEGTAFVGSREFPIVAEVAARPRGRANPSRLQLEVQPGGSAEAEVEIFNAGNVPLDLTGRSSFNLLAEAGLDEALFAAIDPDVPPEKQRIEVLLDRLAARNGGEVKVAASAKPPQIEPGEAATLRLALTFSGQLQPGHRYTGSWKPDGLRLRFTITVADPTPTETAKPA